MTDADQMSLLDMPTQEARYTAPFVPGSRTSREAAKAIEPRVGTQKAIVLACIRDAGPRGCTDEEALDRTRIQGISENSIRARRGALAADGLIEQSVHTRLTKSNKHAVVWIAITGQVTT